MLALCWPHVPAWNNFSSSLSRVLLSPAKADVGEERGAQLVHGSSGKRGGGFKTLAASYPLQSRNCSPNWHDAVAGSGLGNFLPAASGGGLTNGCPHRHHGYDDAVWPRNGQRDIRSFCRTHQH